MLGKIIKTIDIPNAEPVSGMDAAFLYGETPTSPMHVGSVAIIDGAIKFKNFRQTIVERIHLIPKLRKRLINVPLGIDYPYWVDDPNFDVDLHLNYVALPGNGGWKELRAMASQIFSEVLDRSKPLWEFTFVEGLNNLTTVPKGSVAVISKIHHVAIDGMAGASILSLLFDLTPEPRPIKPPPPFNPAPLPNELSLMVKSGLSFAKNPLKFPKLLAEAAAATVKTGIVTRVKKMDLPTTPFSAPPSPLNGIISLHRKWNMTILSLDRVKALKNIMETTLNDMILAICAGALRRYLNEKGKLPPKPLVAMVPISTRKASDPNSMDGNQLSAMLVQLATNIDDPIERIERIHDNTIKGKTYQGALGAKTLSNMAEAVPFGIANQAARLYSRYHIAERHNPVFNLTITNVPGPQFPLYLNGHKLIYVGGTAPIIDGMGLIITIFSYNGQIMISPTSCIKTMPDLDDFTRYIREEANHLEELILARQKGAPAKPKEEEKPAEQPASNGELKSDPVPSEQPETPLTETDKFFQFASQYLQDNASKIKPGNGLFQFELKTSGGPVLYGMDINTSPGVITKGIVDSPDATLSLKEEHFLRIANGKLGLTTAFMQGRLSIKGDQGKAMKLAKILGYMMKAKA
ncbi:MAG: wax ester/triacylglycerol synthase family O-acyltransferase [Bacteroidota bacterium]